MSDGDVTIVAHEVGAPGGMERVLGIVTEGLLHSGVHVTVIARRCTVPPGPLLTFHRVRTPQRPFPLGYPLFALEASWLLRRRASGVVHTTGAIVFGKVDCITIHFCHAAYDDIGGWLRPSAPGRWRKLSARISHMMAIGGERWCYREGRTRAVIAVSTGARAEIDRYFPQITSRVEVIPHGVDCERFKPNPAARHAVRARHGFTDKDLVAIFVGGDWLRKGLWHAVEAVAKADRWRLLVVGPGAPRRYEDRLRELGVTDRVVFVGEKEDIPSYLAAGDVFLLPTRYETFCLGAFEAAAAGLPILITAVNGPDMLVQAGISGDFVDGDVGRTARLLDAYVDDELRRAHGSAARERALTFTWERALSAHAALYQDLAATE